MRFEWKDKSMEEITVAVTDLFEESKDNACPVNRLAQFSEAAMKKSCGECVICREGTFQIMVQCQAMVLGKGNSDDLGIVADIVEDLQAGSCCDYGKLVGARFETLLQPNIEVFEKHFKRKRCDFSVCEKLVDKTPVIEKKEGGLMADKKRRRRSS